MEDLWAIDKEELKKTKQESKAVSLGLICPKRNVSIGEKCAVCDKVQTLFRTKDERDIKIAKEKMAKSNWYMNVVFPENKNKSVIMEVGKGVGNDIVDGAETEWDDIVNPISGKGREMTITKKKGDMGYNKYKASPVLQNANWDVPKEVLANIPNITDNIIEMLQNNVEVFKISSIKMDESLKFRILPWAKDASTKRFIVQVWRHWGVTQAMIDGVEEMDMTLYEERKANTSEQRNTDESVPFETNKTVTNTATKSKIPECFGMTNFYEPEDADCKLCKAFEQCGIKIRS